VNGVKYAWDICKTMVRAKLHKKNLLYDRKFDIGPVEETYDLKLGFRSSHTMALFRRPQGRARVGCRLRPWIRRRTDGSGSRGGRGA